MSEQALEKRKVEITFDDVHNYLCPDASKQEIALFLKVCQSEGLNPFAREIYLIKYDKTKAASIVISSDAYLKAAENSEDFNGCEAGIILKDTAGKLEFREGSFLLPEEDIKLAGGWAKVFRKDREKPFYAAVNIAEYRKYTRAGETTRFWSEMPATMVRKVALAHALREAFPNRFAGTYTTAEIEVPEGGLLPPAFTKEGQPDWSKFWARQGERGIDDVKAHTLLKVASLKKDLVGKGKTLEEVDAMITKALEAEKMPEANVQTTAVEKVKIRAAEEELFPEEEPEIPVVDKDLLKGWEIVKSSIKELKVTDRQIRNWFKHYDLEISLADFDNRFPPAEVTNDILSKFEDSLEIYRRTANEATSR